MKVRIVAATTTRQVEEAKVVHASVWPPTPYTTTGSTYRATCGTRVKHVHQTTGFGSSTAQRPAAPLCPKCVKLVRRYE